MTARGERAAEWIYRGVWAVLAGWFRVPSGPPTPPALAGEVVQAFRPAPGYLRYLKFIFWILLLLIDVAIIVPWLIVCFIQPVVGAIIAIPVWILAVAPDIIAYVGLHLRYDTTWYALTDRSLFIRRGLWVIHETTITYENIQNATIHQGPLQRYFGIANLEVRTAGGGGHGPGKHGGGGGGHLGLLEGITDAERIRDLIMERARRSRSAGLGDEHDHREPGPAAITGWTPAHVEALREILARARRLPGPRPAP
ncbi:MAG: PH domain-containing protein [Phycisphaerales bacterium]|nr:PH domain-containing protein [Phycisphaerales bacterium]